MGVPENIDALLVKYDINQDALARIAGVAPSAITRWRQGSQPRMGAIRNICDHFGLSEDDILSDKYGLAAKEHGLFVDAPLDHIAYSVVGSVEVPVLGKVHAGELMEHDEVEDTTRIPDFVAAQSPNVFVVHSEGDCMDKDFSVNDDLVVNPDKEPTNGSVVIAFLDGAEYIVRRLFRTAQTLILSPNSHNPEYKDIVITADSDTTVEIGGVVIWNQARRLLD